MGKNQVLRTVKDIEVEGKSVLVRLDLDVPIRDGKVNDDSRLIMTWPTVEAVIAANPKKVVIIGHLGRPKQNSEFNMEPVRKWYGEKLKNYQDWELWENLRFNPGEETNSLSFAKDIVRRSGVEVYVFEAFATAHEPHASVISLPKLVAETVVGFQFAAEIRNLAKIWQNPKRPVVFVLGGAKLDTKLLLVEKLTEVADIVLLGGMFPTQAQSHSSKLKVAELTNDGMDISEKSAEEFTEIIMRAGTVVWNGPMGAFEESAHKSEIRNKNSESRYRNTPAYGTYVVAKAMRETRAFTVAGGGDTKAALTKLGGCDGIDWISSGGGAMLYYLAFRTLPFLKTVNL
jgi:phosphoglycerate kinase